MWEYIFHSQGLKKRFLCVTHIIISLAALNFESHLGVLPVAREMGNYLKASEKSNVKDTHPTKKKISNKTVTLLRRLYSVVVLRKQIEIYNYNCRNNCYIISACYITST